MRMVYAMNTPNKKMFVLAESIVVEALSRDRPIPRRQQTANTSG